MATETLSHSQSMIRLFMGYIPTRVIYVAAKLEIADHISDDGASAPELAKNSTSIQTLCIAYCELSLVLVFCTKMRTIDSS